MFQAETKCNKMDQKMHMVMVENEQLKVGVEGIREMND